MFDAFSRGDPSYMDNVDELWKLFAVELWFSVVFQGISEPFKHVTETSAASERPKMPLMLDEHREYLADRARTALFRRAIKAVVRPGDVVLDLGSGTGVLGLLALKAGAARVYQVDESPMIEVARGVAAPMVTAKVRSGFTNIRVVRGFPKRPASSSPIN